MTRGAAQRYREETSELGTAHGNGEGCAHKSDGNWTLGLSLLYSSPQRGSNVVVRDRVIARTPTLKKAYRLDNLNSSDEK